MTTAAYATPADLVARFDSRTIADLASDTGTPVVNLTTDTNVSTALQAASGRVEAALMFSGMYKPTDLVALAGSNTPDTSNSLEYLKQTVCELAMIGLLGRRPEEWGKDFFKAILEKAENTLEMLREGKNLFNLPAAQVAQQADVNGLSNVDYSRLNMIRERTKNFFPARGKGLPLGRGGN